MALRDRQSGVFVTILFYYCASWINSGQTPSDGWVFLYWNSQLVVAIFCQRRADSSFKESVQFELCRCCGVPVRDTPKRRLKSRYRYNSSSTRSLAEHFKYIYFYLVSQQQQKQCLDVSCEPTQWCLYECRSNITTPGVICCGYFVATSYALGSLFNTPPLYT